MAGEKGNSSSGGDNSFSGGGSDRSMSRGDGDISSIASSSRRDSLEGDVGSAIRQRGGNSNAAGAFEGERYEYAQIKSTTETSGIRLLEGNLEAAKAQRAVQKLLVKSQERNATDIKGASESKEHPDPERSDFGKTMNEIRANPELALSIIGRDKLVDRIRRDNEREALPPELREPDADPEKLTQALDALQKDDRAKFVDSMKAKGYIQEEMIRSVLSKDFHVSDKTRESIHEDGSKTFTDIVATDARRNIRIGNTEIKTGESLSVESKAGDERYLASQIEHIAKQLAGMDQDSHRMLVVTADYQRMSENAKQKLGKVLEDNNADLTVLPFYASDLNDMVMHMDTGTKNESGESTSDSSDTIGHGEVPPESGIEKRSFSESLKGLFTGEKSQGTAETQIEKNGERLIADIITVERLLEINKSAKELTNEEWHSVINVGVHQAAERHMSEVAPERLEEITKTISIVDNHQVMIENGLSEDEARYIQGYFEPSTGKIKINKDAIGMDVGEVLVTVDHETLHKLSQRLDETGKTILNDIGLKRGNMKYRNTGMNEGATEMYASRDMEEMLPERQGSSYVLEVDIMKQYETIVGEKKLHDAYMKGGIDDMKKDFDKTMGIGSFDSFCKTMDEMWAAESNGQNKLAIVKHEELCELLQEYSRRKENEKNGNDAGNDN